jgi:CheY-like chemotaxis protein
MAEQEASAALRGRRILVVEDEAVVALWLTDVLVSAGASVVGSVASVGEALARAEDGSLDCAILDYRLPDGTTAPVADLLAARGVPFVFATAYYAEEIDPRYSDRPRVEKAFVAEDLLRAVVSVLQPPARRS